MSHTLRYIAAAAAGLVWSSASAQTACTPTDLIWQDQTLGIVSSGQSFATSSGTAVQVTFTDPSGAMRAGVGPFYQGDYAPTDTHRELILDADLPTLYGPPASTITTRFDLGLAGVGVSGLNFKLFDVDGETRAGYERQERYVIRGWLDGVAVTPTLSALPPTTVALSGNTAVGSGAVKPTELMPSGNAYGTLAPTQGVLNVQFIQPVDRVDVIFSVDQATTPNASTPGFGFDNLHFCTLSATTGSTSSTLQRVPTLSGWGTVGLPVALGVLAWWRQRRRRTTAQGHTPNAAL
jgi:hypothetical protein